MTVSILPCCRPLLLGSLPGTDPVDAVETVFRYTPDFPCWPQLPTLAQEAILTQFTPGLPGLNGHKAGHDHFSAPLQEELDLFLAEYDAVRTSQCSHDISRFILDAQHCSGFFALLNHCANRKPQDITLKGQIVGPLTFLTCLKDEQGTPLYSHQALRRCAVRLLALKAQWQVKQLRQYSEKVIIFVDEPMLFALGKPSLPEISSHEFLTMYGEIFRRIREAGGICGIHVCGSTDWPLVLATGVDIISFDAYHYYRELLLLREELWHFIRHGGMLAFGIVPTDPAVLIQESVESLFARWNNRLAILGDNVAQREKLIQQSFITPSCGTGRLTEQQSTAVLQMTTELSTSIRDRRDDTFYH